MKLIRFLALPVLAASLAACVTSRPVPYLEPGDSLKVQAAPVKNVDRKLDSTGVAVGKYTAAGTVGGAAIGGALMGLGCGPGAIICSPLFGVVGLGAGGIAGGVTGVTHGAATGLPAAKASAFNEAAARLIDESVLHVAMRDAFVQQASQHWSVVDSDASSEADIRVRSLRFAQGSRENVTLIIELLAQLQTPGGRRDIELRYSRSRNIDDWLAEDGARIRADIDAGMEHLARRMVGELNPGLMLAETSD